jgi:hypothetical protein
MEVFMDAMQKIHEREEAVYQLISPQLKEMIHAKSSEGMLDERGEIFGRRESPAKKNRESHDTA